MKISECMASELKNQVKKAYRQLPPDVKTNLRGMRFPGIAKMGCAIEDGTFLWGYDVSAEETAKVAASIRTVYTPLQRLINSGLLDFDAELPLEGIVGLL